MVRHSRFIQACFNQNTDNRPPVWLMRQSGRYLPEYQALRRNATGDFIDFCKNPDLTYKATMIPLKRYALDASIVFSDILVIVDALGLEIQWKPAPHLSQAINCPNRIHSLSSNQAASKLSYVYESIKRIKQDGPNLPCIGFSGSPWTIACYMLDHMPTTRPAERFLSARSFVYSHPDAANYLLRMLTDVIIEYCSRQIESGADALCLFDSWGHILSNSNYDTFSYQHMQMICQQLKLAYPDIPIILFARHLNAHLDKIRDIGAQVIGLDWTTDLKKAQEILGKNIAIQGNLDNSILMCNTDTVIKETQALLKSQHQNPGFILNLGHGILPQTPPHNIEALIQATLNYQ